MSKKKITYAAIVPLIGGEPLGVMKALDGQLPEYVLSYTPFVGHDSHYINYLRETKNWKGEYVLLDSDESYKPKQVDVVMSTCPCAGLSSYSTTSSPDSATNEWLYTTAEYVLANVGPKVFWGENAPRLFSNFGKKVADRLFAIGEKHGYSLNLYYTESHLHGNCQHRPRTFYFFTKSDTAPILKHWKTDSASIEDFLSMPTSPDDPMNVHINKEDPLKNGWLKYAMYSHDAKTIKELYEKIDKSYNCIVNTIKNAEGSLDDVADWFDKQEEDLSWYANKVRYIKGKLDDNKGYWGHGITLVKGRIASFIGGQAHTMINPFTGRYVTLRDGLRVMGMPEDFNLNHENPTRVANHICQNVCPDVAKDMMLNVIDIINGKCELSNTPYYKQNNKNYKAESGIESKSTSVVSDFF